MVALPRKSLPPPLERIKGYIPEQCVAIMEKTGHYYRPLMQYLQEFDIPVYLIYIQHRPAGMLKTDKRDTLTLANILYSQLEPVSRSLTKPNLSGEPCLRLLPQPN